MMLAFDSCLGNGSAALYVDEGVQEIIHLPEPSRQAEWLVDAIEKLVGGDYAPINAMAVTVGPASFTSVRIGLAVAQGFRLALGMGALGVEVLGFSTLDCWLWDAPEAEAVLIDASRGQCYWQWRGGKPQLSDYADIAAVLSAKGKALRLAGNGVEKVAASLTQPYEYLHAQPDAGTLALLAASGKGVALPLMPLYIRPPDAKMAIPLLGATRA